MHSVFVVDQDARDLAVEFNRVAKREAHQIRYSGFLTPEELFEEMKRVVPTLILLHHTWPGYSMPQLLERVRTKAAHVRVVVFTGRELNVPELVECVRNGVCDYWQRSGGMDPGVKARQIATYCESEAFTLESLSRPSGAVASVLAKAEAQLSEAAARDTRIRRLELDLAALSSDSRREIFNAAVRGVEYVVCLAVLGTVFVVVSERTTPLAAGGLVALFAVFFLFLHGKISMAWFDWKKGKVSLEGANDTPPRLKG